MTASVDGSARRKLRRLQLLLVQLAILTLMSACGGGYGGSFR